MFPSLLLIRNALTVADAFSLTDFPQKPSLLLNYTKAKKQTCGSTCNNTNKISEKIKAAFIFAVLHFVSPPLCKRKSFLYHIIFIDYKYCYNIVTPLTLDFFVEKCIILIQIFKPKNRYSMPFFGGTNI